MSDIGTQGGYSKWPHFVAVILACATFPLIWVGGLVTTYDAGMAVPDWPGTYGYNMFAYPISTWLSAPWDLFIEHAHRLLGSLAGMLTIAFNVAIWKKDPRKWMRWLGFAALVLIVGQGLLGGMRVRMDSNTFARIHGCTGPVFFAMSVVLCVMTSRFWFTPTKTEHKHAISNYAIWAGVCLVGLVYFQLLLGAHLRHPNVAWTPGVFRSIVVFHVVTAVLIVAQTWSVTRHVRKAGVKLRRPAQWMALLVASQFVVGILTWRAKYGWPFFLPMFSEQQADTDWKIGFFNTLMGETITAEGMLQTLTVTSHVALGSLILAVSVLYVARVARTLYFFDGQAVTSSRNSSSRSAAQATDMSRVVMVGGVAS